MGEAVLTALYRNLKDGYAITSENISHHLNILVGTLEDVFGEVGSRTIVRVIAKRFYLRMGLEFVEIQGYTLQDYVERARTTLPLHVSIMASETQKPATFPFP